MADSTRFDIDNNTNDVDETSIRDRAGLGSAVTEPGAQCIGVLGTVQA